MPNWIADTVRARIFRQLLAWTFVFLAIATVGLASRRYFVNFFAGPFALAQADLDAITVLDETPRYYVSVQGERSVDTGLRLTEESEDHTEHELAGYYGLVIGDKVLLYKSAHGKLDDVRGKLIEFPATTKEFADIENEIGHDHLYRFMVDTTDEFHFLGTAALVALAAVVLLFLWKGIPVLRYLMSIESHPVVRRIQKWSPDALMELERTVNAGGLKSNAWTVLGKFIVYRSFFGFDALRADDLLWAYKGVTKHSVNFVPTGTTYAAHLVCYGGHATIAGTDKAVDDILRSASESTPWAIFGFSKELAAKIKAQPAELAAAVEARKKEHAAHPAARTARAGA